MHGCHGVGSAAVPTARGSGHARCRCAHRDHGSRPVDLLSRRGATHALVPSGPGSWRSSAADGYADGLHYLRERLGGALSAVVDAESALEYGIARMERRLEAPGIEGAGS